MAEKGTVEAIIEVAKAEVKKEAPKDEPKKTAPASSSTPPAGFVNLFNGKDFGNWWGFGTSDPRKFKALPPAEQAKLKESNMKDILAGLKALFPECKVTHTLMARKNDGTLYDISNLDDAVLPFVNELLQESYIVVDWS